MCVVQERNTISHLTKNGARNSSACSIAEPPSFYHHAGVLHWLPSESLFLARRKIRDVNGNLLSSESKCTCGCSALSVLVFSLTWTALPLIVLVLLLRKMDWNLPLAKSCSLVTSAACYPSPVDGGDHQLRRVHLWGRVGT